LKKQWEAPELEEMPVVILSLHQKWWQKMAAGEKVLELRKTKPQCKAPFRVLVYVTGGAGVLGEFICPEVLEIKNFEEAEKKSKVPAHDIHNYAAGSRNKVYGWEVADVKEYPRAVALEELGIKRAPQSWQYMR
jgi:predicted transcriptional regulator